jgi:hypothetical protein
MGCRSLMSLQGARSPCSRMPIGRTLTLITTKRSCPLNRHFFIWLLSKHWTHQGEYGMNYDAVRLCVCISQYRENRAVGPLRSEGAAVCPQVRPPRCVPALRSWQHGYSFNIALQTVQPKSSSMVTLLLSLTSPHQFFHMHEGEPLKLVLNPPSKGALTTYQDQTISGRNWLHVQPFRTHEEVLHMKYLNTRSHNQLLCKVIDSNATHVRSTVPLLVMLLLVLLLVLLLLGLLLWEYRGDQ